MKAAFVALAIAGLVAAQDFSGQPECAIPCLKDAIPKIGCKLEDVACACKSDAQAKLLPLVSGCILSKCAPADVARAQSAADAACANIATHSVSATGSGSGSASATGSGSATDPATGSGSATATESGTASKSATGSATGTESGSASVTAVASGSGTSATATGTATHSGSALGTTTSAPAVSTAGANIGPAGGVMAAVLAAAVAL